MTTHEEYTAAIKVVESYRKEMLAAYNRGEKIICRRRKTSGVLEVEVCQFWLWDNYDYFLGDAIPLTDKEAVIWPRLKIMVRDDSRRPWHGPFDFLGVDTHGKYVCPVSRWKFARRCTDKEASQPDE